METRTLGAIIWDNYKEFVIFIFLAAIIIIAIYDIIYIIRYMVKYGETGYVPDRNISEHVEYLKKRIMMRKMMKEMIEDDKGSQL